MQKLWLLAACVSALTIVPQAIAAPGSEASMTETAEHALQAPGQQLDGISGHSQRQPSKEMLDKLLKHFDQNGDGVLGPQERAAAERAKDRLDRNHDGEVGKRELEMGQKASHRTDRNKDGRLDPHDKAAAKPVKPRIDRNQDGQLDPHEKAAAKKHRQQATDSRDLKVEANQQRQSATGNQSDKTATRRNKQSGNQPGLDSKSGVPGKNGGSTAKSRSGNPNVKTGQRPHNASLSSKGPGVPSGNGAHAGGMPADGGHPSGAGGISHGARRSGGSGGPCQGR